MRLIKHLKTQFDLLPLYVSVFGAVIAIVQFVYNRSLWGDEAMLAYGIVTTPFNKLNETLPHLQIGPWLYLVLVKGCYSLYNESEMSLRFISVLSYLISIFFFNKAIKKIFLNKIGLQTISMSLYVFNFNLIYYSSELKQYSIDALFATFFLYIYLNGFFKGIKGLITMVCAIILSLLLSSSTIILFPVLLFLLLIEEKSKLYINLKKLVVPVIIVMIFLGLYYIFHLGNYKGASFMKYYWRYKDPSFMPLNIFSNDFWTFSYIKQIMVFEYLFRFGFIWSLLFRLFFVLGIVCLFIQKKWDIAIFIGLPLLIHLIMSSLELYPFQTRFILYLIPGFIILMVYGFSFISKLRLLKVFSSQLFTITISVLLFAGFLGFSLHGFPLQKEEIRRGFKYVSTNSLKDDKVILHLGNKPAWQYYEISKIIEFQKEPNMLFIYRNEVYTLLLDFLKNSNTRIWFLKNYFSDNEIRFIENIFLLNELERIDSFTSMGVELELYCKRPKKSNI